MVQKVTRIETQLVSILGLLIIRDVSCGNEVFSTFSTNSFETVEQVSVDHFWSLLI